MSHQLYYYGTGRRKTSVARVRLYPGNGSVVVNGRPVNEFFPRLALQSVVALPLRTTALADRFNVVAKIEGGGVSGQAGALSLGIARALIAVDEALRPVLRKSGLLTRDPRVKERKKYGLKRARKAPQYTKR